MSSPPSPASDRRLRVLLETMRSFAEAATDSKRLVQTIVEGTTRFLGDGCAIFLASSDGTTLEPVAVYNRDPEVMRLAQEVWLKPLPTTGLGPTATAYRTAAPVLIAELTREVSAQRLSPESAAGLERARARSILSVPLRAHGRVIGALALSRHQDTDPPFDSDDEALACTLADHAALALTNARLLESIQEELRERRRAETEAKKFAALVQHSSDLVAMASLGGQVLFVNEAGRRLLGLEPNVDLNELSLGEFHTAAGLGRAAILQERGRWEGEGELRHRPTGELIPTQVSSFLARGADGEPLCYATVQRDLRERRRLEEHLRHAQKMEAVGQLATGVAHDFNNLLFIVLNYAGALLTELPADSALHAHALEIQRTAERGTALTRQLLAFSRKQPLELRRADLGELVRDVESLLRRLAGSVVALELPRAEGLWPVRVDVGQMEQVLMNLAVNARDAMPRGGTLTVATANAELDASQAAQLECPTGAYVRLSVRDTGTGIEPAIRSRIFDPFFTTKAAGQGTGLGLSIVFGVVKQSGGYLAVSSELGRGTTFEIYLPAVVEEGAPPS